MITYANDLIRHPYQRLEIVLCLAYKKVTITILTRQPNRAVERSFWLYL
jgi:hypothetical protein